MQTMTSANTSINKGRLPASTKKIDWEQYRGQRVLDYGGGKFDNLKNHLKAEYEIDLYIYDKFNRTEEENKVALECQPQAVTCNNVLNVIDSEQTLKYISDWLIAYKIVCKADIYISVYEGDRKGVGRKSKKDCYQRNEKLKEYLRLFENRKLEVNIEKGMIRL